MKPRRFVRVVWGTLALYEALQITAFVLFYLRPPSWSHGPVRLLLLAGPVVAALVPSYLVFSFLGVFRRSHLLITAFFVSFFGTATFFLGVLLTRILLSLPFIQGRDPWTLCENGGFFLILLFAAIAMLERIRPPRIRRENFLFPDLSPDLSGLTGLHLSDLHIGAWQSDFSLRRIARTITPLDPDFLFYTGDLIDHRQEEIQRFERIFGEVGGKLGTFAVLGNHEYWTLGEGASEIMSKAGVPVLKNEFRTVAVKGGTLWVVGIDDPAGADASPFCGPDPERAYRQVNPEQGDLVLTLVHQPTLWEGMAWENSHVTLSGHTHAGQVGRRKHRWNLAGLFFRNDVGLFCDQGDDGMARYLHVSAGLGYFGVPVRIGISPEMTFFTLSRGDPEKRGE